MSEAFTQIVFLSKFRKATMEKNLKFRNWFLQRSFFYETHNADGKVVSDETAEDWKARVKKEWFDATSGDDVIALIFHDKDIMPDGNLKPLHVHGLLKMKNQMTQSAVMKKYHISRQENAENARIPSSSARYLCHLSSEALNSDKYLYSAELVSVKGTVLDDKKNVLDNEYKMYRQLIRQKSGERKVDVDAIISEISSLIKAGDIFPDEGEEYMSRYFDDVSKSKIWKMYRRDFYRDFQEYLAAKAEQMKKQDRGLKTFYIWGKGGSGKTQLANAIAYELASRVHISAAGGSNKTFDFANTYHGEEVSILNEVTPKNFLLREFLSVFDPHQYAPINSRNQDRHWLAKTAILTSSESIYDFIDGLTYNPSSSFSFRNLTLDEQAKKLDKYKDERWQVQRRVEIGIQAVADYKTLGLTHYYVFQLDFQNRQFSQVGIVDCPDITDKKAITETANKILQLLSMGKYAISKRDGS